MSILNLPEHSLEIERAVIGQMLIERECIIDVVKILVPDDFYSDAHKMLVNRMYAMFRADKPIDAMTVFAELIEYKESATIGGAHYLSVCTNNVVSSHHIQDHCRRIKNFAVKRNIGVVCGKYHSESYKPENNSNELLESIQQDISKINDSLIFGSELIWEDVVLETIVKSLKASDNNGQLLGIPSGIKKIDQATLGFCDPDLIILAARPGCGKTTLALNMACNMTEAGIPVGFFSYEMSVQQLVWKLLSRKLNLAVSDIRKGNLSEYQKSELHNLKSIYKLPFNVNDNGSLSITELRATAQSWVRKRGVKIIFVDYIQLIKTYGVDRKFGTREQEVSYISGQLKALAKDLKIPIIALAQLSREAERGHHPQLKDLRESGAIEQDADVVMFIYDDPDKEFDKDAEKGGMAKPIILEIVKFRLGLPGIIKLDFDRKASVFKDETYHHLPNSFVRVPSESNQDANPF